MLGHRFLCGLVLAGIFAASAQQTPLTPLESYLGLTAQQSSEIWRIEAGLALFVREKAARARLVEAEIELEKSRAPLDPIGFRLRYVEIETMRREIRSRAEARAAANRSAPAEEQRRKLPALADALTLVDEITDAECYGLVEQPVWFVGPFSGAPFPGQVIAASRLPAPFPGPFGSRCVTLPVGPFSRLLRPEQRALTERLTVEFNAWAVAKGDRLRQVQLEIQELTGAPGLEAEALGRRYVEIETILQEVEAHRRSARAEFRAVLSLPQIARVDRLAAAAALLPAAGSASCLSLLAGPYVFPDFVTPDCGAVSQR